MILEDNLKNFGEYIKYRRKNIMTQKEFANKIGIGCPYLSKLENGIEPPPSEKVLRLIAKELALKESELFYLAQKLPVELREFILENKDTYDLLIKLFECPELLRHNFLKI